ncbi:MAG: hypothetical protein AAFR91_02130 [Pseudomonadota bacterium]
MKKTLALASAILAVALMMGGCSQTTLVADNHVSEHVHHHGNDGHANEHANEHEHHHMVASADEGHHHDHDD